MWVDVDVALDALLARVGPAVAAHPLAFTNGALELAKAALFALIRRQPFTLGSRLEQTKTKTQVNKIKQKSNRK